MPALGNTDLADEQMAIEVSDQFVWLPERAKTRTRQSQEDDLWQRIVDSPRMPFHLNPAIDAHKKKLESEAWAVEKILKRATPYLNHIINRLEARGLPLDLALLPAIESGYRSEVVSAERAAGLWQIVPGTAKQIGLKRTAWFDGRTDLKNSTRAALDYLSYLNAEFNGNWEHTLAAYNAGPARVKKAMRKNRDKNLQTDFWSLPLPRETRAYVPKFIALIELLRQTPASPLDLPHVPATDYFEPFDAGERVSLDVLAEISGIKKTLFSRLNGGLKHGVTPPKGPHTLLVPAGTAARIGNAVKSRKSAGQLLFNLPKTHIVKAGETLGGIALRYGLSLKQLKELNNLQSDAIRYDQKLAVVDRKAALRLSRQDDAQAQDSAVSKPVAYIIQPGDTLSEIASRFKVPVRRIRKADGSKPDARRLIPGSRLLVPATGS